MDNKRRAGGGWQHSDGLFHPFNELSLSLRDSPLQYQPLSQAPDLLIVSDYSGDTRQQTHQTYSFAVIDCLSLDAWNTARVKARNGNFERTMSYKKLRPTNHVCWRLLPSFLQAANELQGVLATFAVHKSVGKNFFALPEDPFVLERLRLWKSPREQQRVLQIAAWSCFLVTGFASPAQNVTWLSDADAILPNEVGHAAFLEIFQFLSVKYFLRGRPMGKLTIARSDPAVKRNPTLFEEDLLAIPDFVAGALAENSTRDPGDSLKIALEAGSVRRWKCHRKSAFVRSEEQGEEVLSLDPDATDREVSTIGWFHG